MSIKRIVVVAAVANILIGRAFALEEPNLLPKGVQRVRLAYAYVNRVDRLFDRDGRLTELPGANATVTASTLASKDPRVAKLINALNAFQPGTGDNLYTGNLYQDTSMQQNISGIAYEYAVSERWNVGIRFRIVQRNVQTSFRSAAVNNAASTKAALVRGANAPAELLNGLDTVAAIDTSTYVNSLFVSKGYLPPTSFSKTQFAYTELGAKYLIYKSDLWTFSSLGGFRIPTGQNEALNNPLDQGTGGNVWGAQLQGLAEARLLSFLSLTTSALYQYYLSDTRRRAVPRNANDSLPSLLPEDGQVQNVERRLGGLLQTEVAAQLKIPGKAFTIWSAYQFSRKGKDGYAGPGDLFYEGLAKSSGYIAHNGEVGLEYSSIQRYLQHKAFAPFVVSAYYNTTLAGSNTPDVRYVRFDVKLYF